jgi:predicted RNA binding protein YcfA (HicA-like mRNA interferase family)
LESNHWRLVRQKGSHRAFKHPEKPMVVTVPGNWNDDLPLGTLKSIFRKADLKES